MKTVLITTACLLVSFMCFGQSLEPGVLGEYFHIGPPVADFPDLEPNQKPTLKRIDASINFGKSLQMSGVPFTNDYFVRWTGKIRITDPGVYTFFLESDDGSQLYLYDRKVIENGGTHGMREASGAVDLPAGDHTLRINYFQGTSLGGCKLFWAAKAIKKQPIPPEVLFHKPVVVPPRPAPGPGLVAEFFDMGWPLWELPSFQEYETPTVTRIDSLIAYPDVESFSLPNLDHHFYSRWTGKVNIPKTGSYTFILNTDDGSRLSIDGKQMIDYPGKHVMTSEKRGKIELSDGWHDLKLEHFQNEGYAGCILWWEGPDLKKEVIPKSVFSH